MNQGFSERGRNPACQVWLTEWARGGLGADLGDSNVEVIGDFDRNYFDEVMRLRAVWNGFQKEWEEVDRRQALGSSLEEFSSQKEEK